MKVDYYSKTGSKKTEKFDLNANVFEAEVNEKLLSQAVYVYLSNQRESNAYTKDRSEVRGGGKKPWRQKGTGRARHGSTRSPIWTKGGVTFGPTGQANYKKTLTKKMRMIAFKSAFSFKAKNNEVSVIEVVAPTKTKEVIDLVGKVGVTGKVTFIVTKNDDLALNARNLEGVSVKSLSDLSIYDVLNAGKLILVEESVETINSKWGTVSKKAVKKESSVVKEEKKTVKPADKKTAKKTETKETTKKVTKKASSKSKTTK